MKLCIGRTCSKIYFVFTIFMVATGFSQNHKARWFISSENAIQWNVNDRIPHADNIEMAGKRVAAIVSYAIDSTKALSVKRHVFFPQLHPFIKSDDPDWFIYRAYFDRVHADDILPGVYIEDKEFSPGPIDKVSIDGTLNFSHRKSKQGIVLTRTLFPSPSERLFVERLSYLNSTDSLLTLKISAQKLHFEEQGADGKYTMVVTSDAPGQIVLPPGKSMSYSVRIAANKNDEKLPGQSVEVALREREGFLNAMRNALVLETPNATLNTLFQFSKIRASESIYESKLGLIHSPGGGRYYVGIWANDQAEYINPFFPYLGYSEGNESALNTYKAFAKETNEEYKNIRYAFEIEGTVPPFPLDRGDAAMIAYGASQYALALGDKEIAEEVWPLINWCLEYCRRQLNGDGVVSSESDEMEGRIETGTANLSTSTLYYGALEHAADLARSLGKPQSTASTFDRRAKVLARAIENYFGAEVEGLSTYKYYEDHRYLRHWICLPLVVGIHNRKDATIEALFNRLWTKNGVHVEKNSQNEAISKIFWDRGTLYALRGTFLAGATDSSLEKLEQFSNERLLGERVPYVVEAFPEGNMAHLSAESALYCRVFVEGLFGIKPTGLNSFECLPRLPKGWDEMALKKIKAFGRDFNLVVSRAGNLTRVKITDNSTGKEVFNKTSNLKKPIRFSFN